MYLQEKDKLTFHFCRSGKEINVLQFIICDDDLAFCNHLKSKIESIKGSKGIKITVYTHSSELIEAYASADAVFLDIDMPNASGFEVAKEIRKHDSKVKIVFVTSYNEMVYQSFEYAPFRFIRKSYLDNELNSVLSAIYTACENENHFIQLKLKEGYTRKSINEIIYIEIYGHEINIHTTSNEVLISYGDLHTYEKELDDMGFVRISKSYLVNCRYIYAINYKCVVLDDKKRLPLSRKKADAVKEVYHHYLSKYSH